MNDEKRSEQIAATKRNKKIILIVLGVTVAVLAILSVIVSLLQANDDGPEVETYGTVDPSLLHDTKEEDFDIMEYDKYLSLNRTVTYKDGNISVSIDEDSVANYGEALVIMYDLVNSMIAGDCEEYNSYIYPDDEKEKPFTQQQIYDVILSKHSYTEKQGDAGRYKEYVYKLEYKIHENNGSFRNDIESDASRPQYFVINDSTGELLVMDIIERGYLK